MNGPMPDGNTAALRSHESGQDRNDTLLDRAEAERAALIETFMLDEHSKNESKLTETLADLAGGDTEFLHALQRGDLPRMRKLFLDAIDVTFGDDIVDDRAQEIGEERPCQCRGDCTC